jgi:flagellar secretion chaperone FliS
MDNATNEYLRNAVMTASPEQLQLMLYDGAIRFTKQAIEGVRQQKWEDAFNGFNRAQKIILELINALNYDVDRQLCTQMASLYHFIYRKLIEANVDRNLVVAEEALGLLQYQRETWVLLIEKLREERTSHLSPVPSGSHSATESPFEHGTLCLEC